MPCSELLDESVHFQFEYFQPSTTLFHLQHLYLFPVPKPRIKISQQLQERYEKPGRKEIINLLTFSANVSCN